MQERLEIAIDPAAEIEIAAELGSMNVFYDRLESLVRQETDGRASVTEATPVSDDAVRARGGVVEIITAVAGLVAALSPVVIAWIKSRGMEVEETTETDAHGKTRRTLHVRRGAIK